MLPAHKILLRYKTLDKCFRSSKKWTLEMLIAHCSEIVDEKISKRSVQSDIQFLRDNGAPILVKDKKYYAYTNKSYSIFHTGIPMKLEKQFVECLEFAKEISTCFPKYQEFSTLFTQKTNIRKKSDSCYVKLFIQQLSTAGYFLSKQFYTDSELRKITNFCSSYKNSEKESVAKNKKLIATLINSKLKKIVAKIDSRAFLVDAVFTNTQHPTDFQQTLDLPLQERKIPQNLTLWGYPASEKHERPDTAQLYRKTFVFQVFIKDVEQKTGALQVISGSQQRELSPLEISLIANNTHPNSCDVEKGGVVGYKPLIINKIPDSESPKHKPSITLWFSSYQLPVHYIWNNEIQL